jgi:DUF1680 family protein
MTNRFASLGSLCIILFTTMAAFAFDGGDSYLSASSNEMRLTSIWGKAQERSAGRLAAAPLDDPDFILDDLVLKQRRRFAEYSGDLSGRWIGAAAFLRVQYPKPFAAFPKMLAEIPAFQKSDGHFGADQVSEKIERTRDMPIFWGNGRLLVGLVEVFQQTGNPDALQTAKKIGDYLVAKGPALDKRENLTDIGGSLADGFATCYFSCIEGLVALGCAAGDDRYLNQAKRIAELAATVHQFENLHSHGRLTAMRGMADLYGATGERKWLDAVESDWDAFMSRHRLPTGGFKEVLNDTCEMDEGCSVVDWLRLNLALWRLTEKGRYLDEAERCLKNHFIYQQFSNGGAGHRRFHQIAGDPAAFKDLVAEAWWCCSEHWARATADIAQSAVTCNAKGLCINLRIDCEGSVTGPGGKWKVALRETTDGLHVALESSTSRTASVRIHRPAWARQGSRIDVPEGFSVSETSDAWLVEGVWNPRQEMTLRMPKTLRSEPAPGNAMVLLRGDDLLVAHDTIANAWLLKNPPKVLPKVLWSPEQSPDTNGCIRVRASLVENADPNHPEHWKLLVLSPLRAFKDESHQAAWFSFR